MLHFKHHIAPSQTWLQEKMQEGYVCTIAGEFVKKKPLRPLWKEFNLTVWQQQHPASSKSQRNRNINPFDMTDPDVSAARATAFLKWLQPRRSYQQNQKGEVIDGTRWWPWHAEEILDAVKEEQAKHILDMEEEAARSVRWRCDGATKVKVFEWFLKVERVSIQEALLLGIVSPQYDRRTPEPETLLRPAEEREEEWDFEELEEQQDDGGQDSPKPKFKAVPLKEASSQESAKERVGAGKKMVKKTRTAPTAPTTTKPPVEKRTRSGK